MSCTRHRLLRTFTTFLTCLLIVIFHTEPVLNQSRFRCWRSCSVQRRRRWPPKSTSQGGTTTSNRESTDGGRLISTGGRRHQPGRATSSWSTAESTVIWTPTTSAASSAALDHVPLITMKIRRSFRVWISLQRWLPREILSWTSWMRWCSLVTSSSASRQNSWGTAVELYYYSRRLWLQIDLCFHGSLRCVGAMTLLNGRTARGEGTSINDVTHERGKEGPRLMWRCVT